MTPIREIIVPLGGRMTYGKRTAEPWGSSKTEVFFEEGGLAVTRQVGPNGPLLTFTVTHLASGASIRGREARFNTPERALEALQAILPLCDWTADAKTVMAQQHVREMVPAIMESASDFDPDRFEIHISPWDCP